MASSFDRRRANGPESTYPLLHNIRVSKMSTGTERVWNVDPHHALQNPKSTCSDNLVLHTMKIDNENLDITRLAQKNVCMRPDGRETMESRSLYLQTGLIPSASGSALIEAGNTKIVCAVHGPRQVRGRQYAGKAELNVQFEMAPFCERNRRASKDSEVASAAAFVHQALFPSIRIDLLPKSSIDVHIMVLDADTSILGCCALATMAASAAVAQAGVQMYGLVVGTAASATPSLPTDDHPTQQQWLVEPTKSESANASTELLLCGMPSLNVTTCYVLQGPVHSMDAVKEVSHTLMQVITKHHASMAQSLFNEHT